MATPETLSSRLGEILAGTEKPEFAPVQVGTRKVTKPHPDDPTDTIQEKEPILELFRVMSDASDMDALIKKIAKFVEQTTEDFDKGLHKKTALGAVYPKSANVLGQAFMLACLVKDKDLTVEFWLEVAKRSGPIFTSIVMQVDALNLPETNSKIFFEAEKDSATN